MTSHKRPSLRVISGTGHQSISAGHALAVAVAASPLEGLQLALPGVMPSCTVVGVSPAALFSRDLAATLRELHARHVVDMRLAVEFGSLGLDRWRFHAILERLGITYKYVGDVALRHHELGSDPPAMWARFREWLRLDPARAVLVGLRGVVDDGPVVLLSESPRHEGSERQLVMEALQQIRPGLACHHIDPAR